LSDSVVWIKVKHQSFDLAGLLTSSLTLAVLFALLSALIGALLALHLIRRRRAGIQSPAISALNAPLLGDVAKGAIGHSSLDDDTTSGGQGWQNP
jgi:ABC-type spermidine/putrescine transport system permease subunit II